MPNAEDWMGKEEEEAESWGKQQGTSPSFSGFEIGSPAPGGLGWGNPISGIFVHRRSRKGTHQTELGSECQPGHLKEATLPSTANERSWKHRFLQYRLILNHSMNLVPFINKTLGKGSGKGAVELCVANTKKVLWVRPQHWVIYLWIQTNSAAFNLNPHSHQVPWEANETVPGPRPAPPSQGS